ncbi:elongation factor P--(R)-beta-lysine ligase [secondary endosymbiont of Ctenarytaina eucalypti]|uniref:Elongation factor P--(R)-beta-lysine ligase n=1 Tax=secondary endosymbiont of Ctenarytaina eucalypti TaxID=1199245 RepID=J3YRJ3_9ENTR|nr:elongation factor P--(R)-beta-lysine ligase [secondary endosymbiont of Ctenarytaina eucalypti]AFP84693.1 lysyl-tRNA synthetase-like protein GenX [secondary endosymbiont of Ctenarytaina eucalypti]
MNHSAKWQPSASMSTLLKRNKIIQKIREFFSDRGFLEVETPAMSRATVTDVHLVSFQTRFIEPGATDGLSLYLITSPEYHMKRLLAAGSGPIFQICRSFRNEESGRYHNPEFTMLEWYRPNYDMYQLMHEVDDLLKIILSCSSVETFSYQEAFTRYVGLDPLSVDKWKLYEAAVKWDLGNAISKEEDRDTLLQLLFSMMVEPKIGRDKIAFVYHFPASQAAMAAISTQDHRVAERFEVYFNGIELANGFHELTDAPEQRQRFEKDNRKLVEKGLTEKPIDENLLAALYQGMPACAGVALGVDRLVMLALKAECLSDVIAFPLERS